MKATEAESGRGKLGAVRRGKFAINAQPGPEPAPQRLRSFPELPQTYSCALSTAPRGRTTGFHPAISVETLMSQRAPVPYPKSKPEE